ncbi:MAG: Tim44/TimA family putative adaptor protein [Rhodospirillales bacterium]|nr:Tim44/TimA family putative adaptor protein [Rhodospirillales bacterium]
MGEGFQYLDIVLVAMIAGFLVLRLRSVLGRRGDPDGPQHDPFSLNSNNEAGEEGEVVQLRTVSGEEQGAEEFEQSPLHTGFQEIKMASPGFDPGEFIGGVSGAFEMVVKAFAEGDRETLKSLLNDEVYENFMHAIRQREEAGETLENTLVRICYTEAIEAYMEGTDAVITVKIISEQVNITKDDQGEVVHGNANAINEVTDIWSFSRSTRSADPNWQLIATRSLE